MEKKQKRHARSRSFTAGGGVLASFLRSTAASFSSIPPTHGCKAATAASFNHRNAFSGPIVSIVPPEARGGGRKGGSGGGGRQSGYRTPEPSSPKVSCIGQIKRSKSKARKVIPACGKNGGACPLPPRPAPAPAPEGRGHKGSLVKRLSFFRRSKSRSSRSSSRDGCKRRGSTAVAAAPAPAPAGLRQMKRFTSGRAAFQDFDWREAAAVEDEEEEEEMFVAHSAPLVLGGGVVASEPRKEVNLWRRRPMDPPTPLQLY